MTEDQQNELLADWNDRMDQIVVMMQAVNKRADVYAEAAKGLKLAFDATTAAGFSPEQALQIVSRQGAVKLG